MNACPPHHWIVEPVPSDDPRTQLERWDCQKCQESALKPIWRPKTGWGPAERKIMKGEDE